MNKIEQISIPERTVEVGGVEFTLHPLTDEEFLKYQTKAQQMGAQEATYYLLTTTLQKDDENITVEDVKNAPAALMNKCVPEIQELNGLDFSDEEMTELIDQVLTKQENE